MDAPKRKTGLTDLIQTDSLMACYVLAFSLELKKQFGTDKPAEKAKVLGRLLQRLLSKRTSRTRGRPKEDRIGSAYVRWMSGARLIEQFSDLIPNWDNRSEDERKQAFESLKSSISKRRTKMAKAMAAEAARRVANKTARDRFPLSIGKTSEH